MRRVLLTALMWVLLPLHIVRHFWMPPGVKQRVNPYKRIKKFFGLKSTSEAKRMLARQDVRLQLLPDDLLDELGLQRMAAHRERKLRKAIEKASKKHADTA